MVYTCKAFIAPKCLSLMNCLMCPYLIFCCCYSSVVNAKHKFVLFLECFKFSVSNPKISNIKCFGVVMLNNSQNLFLIRTWVFQVQKCSLNRNSVFLKKVLVRPLHISYLSAFHMQNISNTFHVHILHLHWLYSLQNSTAVHRKEVEIHSMVNCNHITYGLGNWIF